MQTLVIYTSQPGAWPAKAFAHYLAGLHPHRRVELRPLSALPAPDRTRRQRLRTERADVARALGGIAQCLQLAELTPQHYPQTLAELRADRARHQGRLAEIDRLLRGAERGGVEL